jgi:repressor LexA
MDRILDYVSDYYLEYHSTPSTTQIANEIGFARGTAYKYLVAMSERGMLQYKDGEILPESLGKLAPGREEVIALGQIACGDPTMEEESLLYRTVLPTEIFGPGPFYILYAKGDSMVDADIEEGDLLLIRKNAEPRVGDIIVALDGNNENTLKRYGGIDVETNKAILQYQNQAVYGNKVILVNELVCQGVLSHVIKEK